MKINQVNQLVKAAIAQVCTLEFAMSTLVVCVLVFVLTLPQNKVPAKYVWVSL